MESFFKRIAIIGMGLMGGSFALAIKGKYPKMHITAYDQSPENLQLAHQRGGIDEIAPSLAAVARGAEIIVLATPVGNYDGILQGLKPHLEQGTLITDLGSIKGYVSRVVAKALPPGVNFIGGHPMAGSERGGFTAATATLFENAYYFLCPQEQVPLALLERYKGLVASLGAFPILITPREHDQIVARISHLPHLTASLLVNLLEDQEDEETFAGGGFRDITRIASGNPMMWRDILLYNRQAILAEIEKLQLSLETFKDLLSLGDQQGIYQILHRAKKRRDRLPSGNKSYFLPRHELVIDLEDKPGQIGALTQLLGAHNINIKEIEVLHVREGELGAIRLGFGKAQDQKRALELLKGGKLPLFEERGVEDHVDNQSN